MHLLEETIAAIRPIDAQAMAEAQREIDYCLKPPGSLGKLEDLARQIAGITGKVHNEIKKKAIVVMMADNGVYAEGIAMYPQDITRIGADFVTSGRMGVNFLANYAKADIIAVDVGIQVDVDLPKVINRKVRYGTANFLKEPAMTREEAVQAIEVGIEVANQAIDQGYDLLGTGEIGIGNTTASSAVLYGFTEAHIDRVVGRGAGLTDEAFERKKQVVREAVELHRPDPKDPLDVLAKVGSLDIAGMTGVYLACAARRVPVVTDGLISNVAALTAMRIKPEAVQYMIPSHISFEPGAKLLKEITGLEPMLDMNMRLGEGTGCALVFSIIEAALRMIEEMGTFAILGKSRDEIGDHIMAYRENFLDNARLVEGRVDFLELLVYTWNEDWRAKVSRWLDGLAALDLAYTVHLPTDTTANALAAARFFVESAFPLLNMTLHPLPGWREMEWPALTAMENLTNRVEFHPRYTFDLTHSLLGQPLPKHFYPHIVELHLSGTDGTIDHLALDADTLELARPLLRREMLVCFEIFDVDDALAAVDAVRHIGPSD